MRPAFRVQKTSLVLVGVLGVASLVAIRAGVAAADEVTSAVFTYTGAAQSWTVPAGVTSVTVYAQGAQGGGTYGGFGGGVRATLPVMPGSQMQIDVGGRGTAGVGGFNGGGGSTFGTGSIGTGPGGGGSSDIRTTAASGETRLVVAGGGGGGAEGPVFGMGGSAGGATGEDGENGDRIHTAGGGGTQVAPGASGDSFVGAASGDTGGNGGFTAGGGGGGWFGGGGGGGDSSGGGPAGGGAGSSHAASNAVGVGFVQGARTGDGQVELSWGSSVPAGGATTSGTFAYTGGPQVFQVPAAVSTVDAEVVGGQGGGGSARPGFGADVTATIPVTGGQVLAVLVGGHGGPADGCGALTCGDPGPGSSVGGFNGGGTSSFAGAGAGRGSGGGGATDIRPGSWRASARTIVAGGGGGASINGGGTAAGRGQGGDAKGTTGDSGAAGDGTYVGGGGGQPSVGGKGGGAYAGDGRAGQGGPGGFSAGSGGGGWFGGGGGGGDSSGGSPGGGGAGSSYAVAAATNLVYATSGNAGDGSATIRPGASAPTPTPAPTSTPVPTPTPTPTTALNYVALGDSFAAGEGAVESAFLPGTSFADPVVGHGATIGCHRSTTSWANSVAAQLKQTAQITDFRFVACSGAKFDNLFGQNTKFANVNETEPAQIASVNGQTAYATMIMGGNDVGFEPVLANCVSNAISTGDGFGCSAPGTTAWTAAQNGLEQLRSGVATPSRTDGLTTSPVANIYATIAQRMAPGGKLIVVGYPHLFSLRKGDYPPQPFISNRLAGSQLVHACTVGQKSITTLRVKFEDAQWINGLVDSGDVLLNSSVVNANAYLASAGYTQRVFFVDVRSKTFDSHALCTAQQWFNGVQLAGTSPKRTSFHPNASGQKQYAKVVDAQLSAVK